MIVGQGAEIGVGGQVGAQPLFLRRTGGAAVWRAGVGTIGVEGNDMPSADVVALISQGRVAGRGS